MCSSLVTPVIGASCQWVPHFLKDPPPSNCDPMLGHNHSFRATLFHSSDRTVILQQQEKAPCFPYAFILAHDNCTFSPSFSLFVASSGPNLSVPAPYCSALHPHRFPLNAQAFPHLSITNSPFPVLKLPLPSCSLSSTKGILCCLQLHVHLTAPLPFPLLLLYKLLLLFLYPLFLVTLQSFTDTFCPWKDGLKKGYFDLTDKPAWSLEGGRMAAFHRAISSGLHLLALLISIFFWFSSDVSSFSYPNPSSPCSI